MARNQIYSDSINRDTLIVEHLSLVNYIAGKYCSQLPAYIENDDIYSAAKIGLINAVDRFDPGRGVLFKVFAEQHIKGAIQDELRSLDILSRNFREKYKKLEHEISSLEKEFGRAPSSEEVAKSLGIDIESYYKLLDEVHIGTFINIDDSWEDGDGNSLSLADILAGDSSDNPQQQAISRQLAEALGEAIERLPEKERLAITLYYNEELNLKEIAELLGLCESRISQLLSQAMTRLKSRMRIHKN